MYDILPQMQKIMLCGTEKITIIEKIICEFEDRINNLSEQNEKMKDFNIAEMLKGNAGNIEGLNGEGNNIILNLISGLENKVNSISKSTEKLDRIDETNHKMQKDIQFLKNGHETNRRTLNALKETTEDIILNINNINDKNKEANADLVKNLELKMKSIQKEEEKDNSSKLEDKENKEGKESFVSSKQEQMDLENNEKIREIMKRISDLEKMVKQIPGHMGIEQIKSDINALKSGIGNCALAQDLKEAKEREDEMQRQLSFLKDQFDDFITNTADHDDLQNVKRKLEIINNKLHETDTITQELMTKMNQNVISKSQNIASDKYLEIQRFEDFKAQIIKEFTSVNDNFTHLRRLVDNILDSLKNKPSYRDIKALEEELLVKFEELKVASAKKFAERIETTKNFKYLDQQIKHILQVYIKKENKADNWLLAKKPLNANLCASCEAYIGDLKDNSLYQPWNKYPMRDPNDKLYRLGNGFSKMLQMIQVDENDKKNMGTVTQPNNNDLNKLMKLDKLDSNANTATNMNVGINKTENNNNTGNNKILPKIKPNNTATNFGRNNNINKNINMISSNENPIEQNEINDISDEEEEQPKITKIVKVNN